MLIALKNVVIHIKSQHSLKFTDILKASSWDCFRSNWILTLRNYLLPTLVTEIRDSMGS